MIIDHMNVPEQTIGKVNAISFTYKHSKRVTKWSTFKKVGAQSFVPSKIKMPFKIKIL